MLELLFHFFLFSHYTVIFSDHYISFISRTFKNFCFLHFRFFQKMHICVCDYLYVVACVLTWLPNRSVLMVTYALMFLIKFLR